jgi:hypothetical protein
VIILDHLFDPNQAPKIAWIGAFLVALLPPIILACKSGIKWIKKASRVQKGKYDISTYVDTFDNSVCYWALMSRSFLQYLKENGNEMSQEEKLFYYQEIHFYINKSCKKLDEMMPVAEKVFTNKITELNHKNLISLQRVNIIINLLKSVGKEADEEVVSLCQYRTIIEDQKALNKGNVEKMERLLRKIASIFPDYHFEPCLDMCK